MKVYYIDGDGVELCWKPCVWSFVVDCRLEYKPVCIAKANSARVFFRSNHNNLNWTDATIRDEDFSRVVFLCLLKPVPEESARRKLVETSALGCKGRNTRGQLTTHGFTSLGSKTCYHGENGSLAFWNLCWRQSLSGCFGYIIALSRSVSCHLRNDNLYLKDLIPCWIEWSTETPLFEMHWSSVLLVIPRSGELRTQKLKSHLVRTQSLNVLPFKPGVGQYIAIHATLTARDFFPCLFLHFQSIHLHFFQNLSQFFPVLAKLQNKIGHPAGCRFPCWVPAAYK